MTALSGVTAMSRGYRVRYPAPVWHNVSAHVESADNCAMDVALLDILPEPDMLALLRTHLQADGWQPTLGGALSKQFGDVTAELTPDGKSVTIKASAKREVVARGTDSTKANEALDQVKAKAERELAGRAGKAIAAAEGDVRASVQAALQKVYVEALKRKAASLGEIEGMQESRGADGELELTIKVRVP